MSALRGIGAAFEGFTKGLKLADEMETNEQNRKMRLAAEEREAERFKEEQRVRETSQLLQDAILRTGSVSSMDELNALRSEVAAGPKKKTKGVSAPPAQVEQPAAAGIAPPAPAATDQPPATGIPSPAQTFAYGTNPAAPLNISPEGAAPAEPAPAPAAPEGQPQQPAPRMIPAYGTDKKLREEVYKTSGDFLRRLALLQGKTELALRIPEITQKALDAQYDRTIGRAAIEARLGDVGALRKLLEVHGPEVGFEGYKVPVGAAQAKDGSWEVVGPNGPEKITSARLDAFAIGASSPAAILQHLTTREDKAIAQGQKDRELDTAGRTADANILLGQARLEEARVARAGRDEDRASRRELQESQARDKAERAGREALGAMIGFDPRAKTDNMLPKQLSAHEAKGRQAAIANQIYNASIDPDQMTPRSLPSAVFEVTDILTEPDNIRDRINRDKALQPDEKKSLEAALANAINRRADLTSKVQRDERGYFVTVNGIRVVMPKPSAAEDAPARQDKQGKPSRATTSEPSGILGIRAEQQKTALKDRAEVTEAERRRLRAAGLSLPGEVTDYAAP